MNKLDYLLMKAKKGHFGKPTRPKRDTPQQHIFWNAYFGMERPNECKPGEKYYFYFVAGRRFKLWMKEQKR